MTTTFAIYSSPIGSIHIEHLNRRLSRLQILDLEPEDLGSPDDFTDMVYQQIEEYLRGDRKVFDIELDISHTTPFQQAVLKELQRIPYGTTATYKDIAVAIKSPKAARAIGMANNRNPIHIIIPCHRVIGSNGSLTGYAAGIESKCFLLNLEAGNLL